MPVKSFLLFAITMVLVLFASAIVAGATFFYSWLWALVSPFSLWQIVILMMIMFIPLLFKFGASAGTGIIDSPAFLVFGAPVGVGIGMLLGWFATLITGVDRWHTTLVNVIIVSTVLYATMKIGDVGLQLLDAGEEWDSEEEDDDPDYYYDPDIYELDDNDVDQVLGLSNKKSRKRKQKRKRK